VSCSEQQHHLTSVQGCRKRKIRCDASRPRCSNCHVRGVPCHYAIDGPPSDHAKKRISRGFDSLPPISPSARLAENNEPTYLGHSTSLDLVTECSETPNVPPATIGSPLSRLEGLAVVYTADAEEPASANGLPSRSVADRLIDAYFERAHYMNPILHENKFRLRYLNTWNDQNPAPRQLSWYALLNMVFAFGSEVLRSEGTGDTTAGATKFVDQARNVVLSSGLGSSSLDLVQAMLLMCHWLQGGAAEMEECWKLSGLAIRTATSLGLHLDLRDSKRLPIDEQIRKRTWWVKLVVAGYMNI
jgi:hypothetical protein